MRISGEDFDSIVSSVSGFPLTLLVFLDYKLIGYVKELDTKEGWVDVYDGGQVVRKHGRIAVQGYDIAANARFKG